MTDERGFTISERTKARLKAELDDLLSDEVQVGSVGSAIAVRYEKEFAEKHNIGQWGRMTLKDGQRIFHAASKEIENDVGYEFPTMDYTHVGWRYREGLPLNINLHKLCSLDEWPEKVKNQTPAYLSSIERVLFTKLGPVITLVNPSFKTLQTLDSMSSAGVKSLVFLSSGSFRDVDYNKRVRHFVSQSKWLAMTEEVEGVAYLGSSQPNFYPEIPWVRLIPSPFIQPCSHFLNYSATWDEHGYRCVYERKPGYFVYNSLRFDDGKYLYNPETVDQNFRDKVRPSGLAFLQSSIPLKLVEADDRRMFHKPRFLEIPKTAEWVKIINTSYRVVGKLVYDVTGPGTYTSRRTRVMLPTGYEWAPYSNAGSHWVSLSSLRPRRDYDIHVEKLNGSTFICFGDTRPVEVERRLSVQHLWYDEREAPTLLKGQSNLPVIVDKTAGPQIRDEYWESSIGQIFPHQLRKEDAVAWKHQVDQVPFYQGRDLEVLPRFVGKTGVSFVDVSSIRAKGEYYLCSSREYLMTMMPQASKYFSKNYFKVFTYAPHAQSIEEEGEEYQSKYNPEWNNIITDFKSKIILHSSENARSEQMVSNSLGIPLAIVNRYVRVHPDMLFWKTGSGGNAQWVHRMSLQVRFQGEGTVAGKLWTQVMQENQVHTATVDVSHFRIFCLNNGFFFKYLEIGLNQVQFRVMWKGK